MVFFKIVKTGIAASFSGLAVYCVSFFAAKVAVERHLMSIHKNTPLHIAVADQNAAKVERLLKKINPNVANNKGYTPLHFAVLKKHEAIVKLLLARNADVNLQDQDGYTLLHLIALHTGDAIIAQLLIEHGADVNAQDNLGNTPLHLAIASKAVLNEALINLFIAHTANVNLANQNGHTPLHIVAASGIDELVATAIANLLLEHESDINAQDNFRNTPLHLAAASTASASQAMVHLLTAHKANVNLVNQNGYTPLHVVVALSQDELQLLFPRKARVLLEHGADVDAQDNLGNTPLHLAAGSRLAMNLLILESLIKHTANVNLVNQNGYTPLQIAGHENNGAAIASMLVREDINIDLQDNMGDTASHYSVKIGGIQGAQIIFILLARNANFNIKNNLSKTPLSLAQEQDDPIILALLSGSFYKIFENENIFEIRWIIDKEYPVFIKEFMTKAFFQIKLFYLEDSQMAQQMLDNWNNFNDWFLQLRPLPNQSIPKLIFKREISGHSF